MNNFIQRGLAGVAKQQVSNPESIKQLGEVLDTMIHTRTIENRNPQINADEYIR